MRVQVISAAVMLALLSRAPGRAQSAAAATCPSAVSPRRAGNPYGCQGEAAKFSEGTVQTAVNGASFQPGLGFGSWFSVTGTNLASTTRIWGAPDFQGNNLPTSLDGTRVEVNGTAVPIYFISPGQVNALAPQDLPAGDVSITVTNSAGTAIPVTATLRPFAPALFPFEPENGRYAAAVHADGVLVGKAGLFGAALVTRPAKPGDRILLFGTRYGPTSPPLPFGVIVQSAAPLANPVTVRVASATAVVEFAGAVGVGLYQLNLVVPNLPNGDHAVTTVISGISSPPLFLTIAQ